MKYYKYSQIVKEFNVSDRTVRNWVTASLNGKADLSLHERNGKYYISETAANNAVMEKLATYGKRYRNSRSQKASVPEAEFYSALAEESIVEIINKLEKDGELPWLYALHGDGLDLWNSFLSEQHIAGKGNAVGDTIDVLKLVDGYLSSLLSGYDRINLIVLGNGNGITEYDLVSRVRQSGKLENVYFANPNAHLQALIAENFKRWFGGDVVPIPIMGDIQRDALTVASLNSAHKSQTISVYLMLSDALTQNNDPTHILRMVRIGMRANDLLITTARRNDARATKTMDAADHTELSMRRQLATKLFGWLGVPAEAYEIETAAFKGGHRTQQIRFRCNVTLSINIGAVTKSLHYEKGDSIIFDQTQNLSETTVNELFENAGFAQQLMAQSASRRVLMTVSYPDSGKTHE